MSLKGVRGHDSIASRFQRALVADRLPSTFLFVGPPGIGKRTFADKLAQALLCETNSPDQLDPCGICPTCQQVAAGSHPDVDRIEKPTGKSVIPVELLIGDREHRMREGLCRNIALKPYSGKRRIAIIDDADYLNQEGANCLLKTLEEPPPAAVIILICSSLQRQLPTIRSRSQTVRFQPLSEDDVRAVLIDRGLADSEEEAARLAAVSGGSVSAAIAWRDPELAEFRKDFTSLLVGRKFLAADAAKMVGDFIDQAGKDAPARRQRFGQVIQLAISFYRQLLRASVGLPIADSGIPATTLGHALQQYGDDQESIACGLERCVEAEGQLLANANQATLLECWLDDLLQIHRAAV